jgi:hypothetical protein
MISRYRKFILESQSFDFTKEEIDECFIDLVDDHDAFVTSFIREDYVSVVIFIEFEKWESDKSIAKMVSDCFIRLRSLTGLVRIESRDRKNPETIRSKYHWIISRKLALK